MTTSKLDILLENYQMPGWRLMAWPVMIMLASVLIWSNYAKLEEVTVAKGVVTPMGAVKTVQHLEGGIVTQIHVADGSLVKKGDPLILLDLATSGVNREELQVRLDGEILLKARLEAEAQGKKTLEFPADIATRRPDQVQAQTQNFKARDRQLNSMMNVLAQAVTQRRQEVKELEARHQAIVNNLKLAQERLRLSTSLIKDGLTSKIEHLQLKAEVEGMDGDVKSLKSSISRAKSAISEAQARIVEERDRFRSEARQELGKTEQSIGRVQELLASATEQGARAMIRSPIDGIVQNLAYNTIGGVVRPGELIMEIVPTGAKLVIDARLNPVDRGYVTLEQPVVVKLSTFDYARFGGLDGHVMMVAPDTSIDEEGEHYFRVLVEVDKTYFGDDPDLYKITPGMQATIDIHTGEKSVMEFLIKPVLKLKSEAFRER